MTTTTFAPVATESGHGITAVFGPEGLTFVLTRPNGTEIGKHPSAVAAVEAAHTDTQEGTS